MTQPNLRERLLRGAQAQVVGVIERIVVQVLGVSILVGTWGLDLFGEWLILAAIPIYLSVSDIGLFAAASNDMIMRVARGDREGALRVFQATSMGVGVVFLLLTMGLVVLVVLAPVTSWFRLDIISESTADWIVVAMGGTTLVSYFGTVIYGGFACVGRYGEGVLLLSLTTLVGFFALASIVLAGGGPGAAAAAMLITRVAGTGSMYLLMRRRAPWLRLGRPAAVISELRPLLSAATASGAFTASLTLNVQGMVILVGVVLGPASAAVFSILRTLSRIINQILARVFVVVSPELSRAYAEGAVGRMRALHRRSCQAAFWLAAPIIVALTGFGDSVLRIWTNGTVSTEGALLYMFLAMTGLNSLWYTSLAVVFATNRHQRLGLYYFIASAATLALAYVLLLAWDLEGAVAALLAMEAVMLVIVLRETIPAAHDTLRGWLTTVLRPPPVRAVLAVVRPEPRAAPTSVQPASSAAEPPYS